MTVTEDAYRAIEEMTCDALTGQSPVAGRVMVPTGNLMKWATSVQRVLQDLEVLERDHRAAKMLIGNIIHSAGGTMRIQPVLLRGDEEIIRWDDQVTGDMLFRFKSSS